MSVRVRACARMCVRARVCARVRVRTSMRVLLQHPISPLLSFGVSIMSAAPAHQSASDKDGGTCDPLPAPPMTMIRMIRKPFSSFSWVRLSGY